MVTLMMDRVNLVSLSFIHSFIQPQSFYIPPQQVDLRLDALEGMLNLPITFVSGHIHELRLHVPWTKLGSEPVVITFNTIECVVKVSTIEFAEVTIMRSMVRVRHALKRGRCSWPSRVEKGKGKGNFQHRLKARFTDYPRTIHQPKGPDFLGLNKASFDT